MRKLRIPLRIVLYKESGRWVAYCLEFSLIGDGVTQDEALHSLNEAIACQVEEVLESQNLDNLFFPADSEMIRKFAEGKDRLLGELQMKFHFDDTIEVYPSETREFSEEDSILT